MRVAIGSTSAPKVEAVQEAWRLFSKYLVQDKEEPVDFAGFDLSAVGPGMPLSVKELMGGAQTRAEELVLQLKREKAEADFYIGLEEGFNVIDSKSSRRLVFMESWAYVTDGHLGYFGHGGGILAPKLLVDPVVDRGIELGIAIDRFCSRKEVKSEEGTWGVLSRDIVTRKHSFVTALIGAFAPFYHSSVYR